MDWNTAESQALRFRQLSRLLDDEDGPNVRSISRPISLIDYGCGYGALVDHLMTEGRLADGLRYVGFDVSAPMIDAARARHVDKTWCTFTSEAATLQPADFVVASGIFNVKLDQAIEAWRAYLFDTLDTLHALSTRGFAFNVLSMASDPDKRRDDLFYADAGELLARCQQRYSRRVALLHDTPLYELTMLVRK